CNFLQGHLRPQASPTRPACREPHSRSLRIRQRPSRVGRGILD
ncbi:hypothetical protein BN1708_020385, partial [Verticillium longisporum]